MQQCSDCCKRLITVGRIKILSTHRKYIRISFLVFLFVFVYILYNDLLIQGSHQRTNCQHQVLSLNEQLSGRCQLLVGVLVNYFQHGSEQRIVPSEQCKLQFMHLVTFQLRQELQWLSWSITYPQRSSLFQIFQILQILK